MGERAAIAEIEGGLPPALGLAHLQVSKPPNMEETAWQAAIEAIGRTFDECRQALSNIDEIG